MAIGNQIGCDRSKITLESHLIDDLGADSLNAIEIVMDIENEFGITIDDKQVESISKVKDIVALVESK